MSAEQERVRVSLLRQDNDPRWYERLGLTPEAAAEIATRLHAECAGWGAALNLTADELYQTIMRDQRADA